MPDESAQISSPLPESEAAGERSPVAEGPPARWATLRALRQAMANDGIRRLGICWTLGIAADAALTVVTLVMVFNLEGIVAAGLLGALRLVPAIAVGTLAGSLLERFRGDRILAAVGIARGVAAVLTALAIVTAGSSLADHHVTLVQLFVLAGVSAAAGAPVRPTQVTLMPAIARSPAELVAANTAWSTGEGFGAFIGPVIAGVLMAAGMLGAVAAAAAAGFLATAVIAAGLRFEQTADASGGGHRAPVRLRLAVGLQAIRSRPVLAWTMLGTFGQVVTRGLLNAFVVASAIDLLSMGQSGPAQLMAALGAGGLIGMFFAMSSVRSERLVRTEIVALAFWGLPLAAIGLLPLPVVAALAMIVIGVANATYDVALFTILQRGASNDDRAPVMSVLEAVIGLGGVTGSLLAPVLLLVLGPQGGLLAGGLILPVYAVVMFWRVGRTERVTVVNESLVQLLRKVPAFAELPMTAIERVAASLVPFASPAGATLMRQGELGDTFVVTETGEIEVLVDGRPIHRLGPGAGIGEIALLRRSPRTATVVATTDVTGYRVGAGTFLAAIAGPAAAATTERMAEANLRRAASTA